MRPNNACNNKNVRRRSPPVLLVIQVLLAARSAAYNTCIAGNKGSDSCLYISVIQVDTASYAGLTALYTNG